MRGRRTAIAVALAALAAARPASAAPEVDRAVARALAAEGSKLLAKGQVAEACPKLEESRRLLPVPETTVKLAECLEKAGKTATAWALYLDAAATERDAKRPDRERAANAKAAAIEPKLSRMRIVVTRPEAAPGIAVKRNDVDVGTGQWGVAMPIDPGTYTITAAAPGRYAWRAVVVVDPGGARVETVVPELPPLPTYAPPPERLSRRERREAEKRKEAARREAEKQDAVMRAAREEQAAPREEPKKPGDRASVGMMATGITLLGIAPIGGALSGVGMNATGARTDTSLGVGLGVGLGVAALGLPLTLIGAKRVPGSAREGRIELRVAPGGLGITGAF
jgi:hypothetical protein